MSHEGTSVVSETLSRQCRKGHCPAAVSSSRISRAMDRAMTTRLDSRFARCRAEGRAALVTFVMAGDPDPETSLAILNGASGRRRRHHRARHALHRSDGRRAGDPGGGPAGAKAGQTMARTLAWCARFRAADAETPIVLMGYYNPIYIYGVDALPRRRQGGRRRRADRRRPAAGGGRRALPAGARGRPQFHPPRDADHRRPAPARRCSRTRRASSTTSRSPASPAPRRPILGEVATAVERIKRHTDAAGRASASASRRPTMPRRSREGADGVVVGTALVEARAQQRSTGHGRRDLADASTP